MKRRQLKQRSMWPIFFFKAQQWSYAHDTASLLHQLDVYNCGGHSNLACLNNSDSVKVAKLSKDISEAKFVGRSNVFY